MKCPICSQEKFEKTIVLKQRLIDEWELSSDEVDYVNKQQGYFCANCFCNLRSMTLADNIMKKYSFSGQFRQFSYSKFGTRLKILEINEAGGLHPFLMRFRKYVFAEYPKVDIQKLPYIDNFFDLIVHSDTLEHVENSLLALQECYRVLNNGGILFYTIPIIYKRMTRSRDNLCNSYHGSQDEAQGDDYKVYREYGADFWVEIINAGFTDISIGTLGDLSSIAICAKKEEIKKYKQNNFLSVMHLYSRVIRKINKYFK
jgi:SAM-dependent methyltransferase